MALLFLSHSNPIYQQILAPLSQYSLNLTACHCLYSHHSLIGHHQLSAASGAPFFPSSLPRTILKAEAELSCEIAVGSQHPCLDSLLRTSHLTPRKSLSPHRPHTTRPLSSLQLGSDFSPSAAAPLASLLSPGYSRHAPA